MGWGGIERVQGSETILYKTILIGACHYTSVQTHRLSTARSERDADRALWVMMTRHGRSICGNEGPAPLGDVDNGGGCAWVGAGGTWKLQYHPEFDREPKTTLKK